MTARVILCGGGSRSGSTWQYNAVRAILREAGTPAYGAWIEDYDPARPEPAHVVKLHRYRLAARFPDALAVGCYRDLRDVVRSLDRMGWLGNGRAATLRRLVDRMLPLNRYLTVRRFLDEYVRSHADWTGRAIHMMRYEDMVRSPVDEVHHLARAIGAAIDETQAQRIAAQLAALRPPEGGGADHETQLHPGHLGTTADRGDPRLRRFVTRRYRDWLAAHGYAAEASRAGP
ncbi:sulfotransferase [Sphingomonas sp.]|uniref:sulfotransferase n=1 Tax=Sphingomonas sp. TaxID=28214 RepID=UPI001B0EF602|nr:sulfotransferase [Sphingomonas sp.]MBO9714783.1 sulfotransferase [Sphingomonas sp.]